jgi:Skp family chaperone for outer membrane proteins
VKRSLTFVLAAALIGTAFVQQAQAQRPAAPEVALIDLNYVFKNHAGFKAAKSELQAAVDMAQLDIKTRQEKLKQMQARLQEYQPGSPDFKTLETQLTKELADLNLSVQLERKRFIEREAQMAYDLYKQVLDEVTLYCRQNGIRLVLRFNGEPLDMNKPEHVAEQLNRNVVYHESTIDITPVILQRLNAPATPTAQQQQFHQQQQQQMVPQNGYQVPATSNRPGVMQPRR